jgi:3-phenylpropionate/cinnamic acid dioxygenase small subunit
MQKKDSSMSWIKKPEVMTIRICSNCKIANKTNEGEFQVYNNGLNERFFCKPCRQSKNNV